MARTVPVTFCAKLLPGEKPFLRLPIVPLTAVAGRVNVQQPLLKSGWDTILLGGPLVAMLLVRFFGLDEVLFAPKRRTQARAHISRTDPWNQPPPSDPDGRPWPARRPRRRP